MTQFKIENKKIGMGALAIAVSLTLLTLLWSRMGVDRVISLLSHIRVGPLTVALGITLLFPFLASWRWKSALSFCEVDISMKRAIHLIWAAWPFVLVIPAKLGSLILVWALRKEKKTPRVFLSLIVERVFDLPVLLALSILGGIWDYPKRRIELLVGLMVLLFVAWILFKMRGPVLMWIRSKWSIPLFDLDCPRSRKSLIQILMSSVVIWILSMAQWQAALYALGIQIDFLDSFLRVPWALLAGMIPVAWMGVGTRDGAFLMVYAGHLPMEKVLAASFIFTTLRYLIPGLLGLPWTFHFIYKAGKDKMD